MVAAKDGQVTVDNTQVTAVHKADGTDVVKEKASGDVVSKSADGTIHDKAADRNTTITPDQVTDQFHSGFAIARDTKQPLSGDTSQLKPGQAQQGSDGIVYKSKYSDAEGPVTVTANNEKKTITMEEKDGDKLVLDAKAHMVTFTGKGEKPETMTLQQFKQTHGDDFKNFQLDSDHQVSNAKEGVVVKAHESTATLVKTDPTTKDVIQASVSADGTSDLKHTDATGAVVSESRINYNDPDHAYQQLDTKGQVIANYDLNNNTFQGQGFAFNDSGMQVFDGNVFVGDDGNLTTNSSDSVVSDGSVSITGDGVISGSGVSADPMLASELQPTSTEVSSALASGDIGQLDGAIDQLIAMDQMNPSLNLSSLISRAEAREDGVAGRAERKASREDKGPAVLDFTGKDIYAA